MNLGKKNLIIVGILSLLTALESLSIDLYLPAFKNIASDLDTDMGKVQVSLSMFLGGFALGQLLWGSLSDRFGRRKPLIIAITLYALISILVLTTNTIQELWLYRFLQAFTGSAGVVIARAVVTDWFDRKQTASIFALLGLIMGVAPIIAPSIGNYLLGFGHWYNVFIAMSLLGLIAVVLVILFLPETRLSDNQITEVSSGNDTIFEKYWIVFRNKQFLLYTIIGSFSYSALMIYISNSPFLIMEKGQFSGTIYSLIFGINAIGMMMATFSVTYLSKKFTLQKLVKYSILMQVIVGLGLVFTLFTEASIVWILFLVFLFLLPTGVLFPTTTDLALTPFSNETGTASALLGFAQLGVTFIFSGIIGLLQNNSIAPMLFSLLSCGLLSWVLIFIKQNNLIKSNRYESKMY